MDEDDSPFTAHDARTIAESAYNQAMQAIACERPDADFSVHTGVDQPIILSTSREASLLSDHSAASRAAFAVAAALVPSVAAPPNPVSSKPETRTLETETNEMPSQSTPKPTPGAESSTLPHRFSAHPNETPPFSTSLAEAGGLDAGPVSETEVQHVGLVHTTPVDATATAQERAWWSCEGFSSLAATPHEEDPRLLSRFNLEAKLLEQGYSEQPSRQSLEVTECVVRDVVNSVVKNIVGIVECLVDRILMDKKQDVLRTLVGELMTQETHHTVAAGLRLLRNHEMQEVDKTVNSARQEMQELKDACQGLKQQMDGSEDRLAKLLVSTRADEHQGWMDRLGAVEEEFVSRREFGEKLSAATEEIFDLRHHIHNFTNTWGGLRSTQAQDLADLRTHCETNLATKVAVSETKEELTCWVTELKGATQLQLQEISQDLSQRSDKRFECLDRAIRANVDRIDKDLDVLKEMKDQVALALKSVEESKTDLAAFKTEAGRELSELREAEASTKLSLSQAIAALEARSVTKADLAEVKHLEEESLANLSAGQANCERKLEVLHGSFQAKCENDELHFATLHVMDKAVSDAELRLNSTIRENKESLLQLWSDFGTEQERSRDWENYQSTMKNNLNRLVEAFHALDNRNRELGKENNHTADRVDQILKSQAESQLEKELYTLSKAHSETIRKVAGLESQVAQSFCDSRREQEDLRNYSSVKMMDQIDKALTLHGRQNRLESDYLVLSNAVKLSSGDPHPDALRDMLRTPSTGPPPSPWPDSLGHGYTSSPTPPEGVGGRPGRPQSAVRRNGAGPPRPHTAGPTTSAAATATASSIQEAARLPSLP